MPLASYEAYDTSVPIKIFETKFIGYIERLQTEILDYLNANFNFGRNALDIEYYDFWKSLINPANLNHIEFEEEFNIIKNYSQEVNNMIGQRYMDYVGMVTTLDPYMCFAGDIFSRITDTAWSFGDGQAYMYRIGKILPDGTQEILRKGLKSYQEELDAIYIEMKNYILTDNANDSPADTYGMDRSRFNNVDYLSWKKTNYFLPRIKQIDNIVKEAKLEVFRLVELVTQLKDAINIWFPESFKLVAYTSLAFNLNKKNENLATKIIGYSNTLSGSVPPRNVVTTTSLIAVSQAKFWKAKVLPDMTNMSQCLTEAIIHGFAALVFPSRLEDFVDLTWEFMIPKY